MALFTSAMPAMTGDTKKDIESLNAWARRLTAEFRSLIYALDEQNVLKAKAAQEADSVSASGVYGVLNEKQIPDIDISKVKGNRPYCITSTGDTEGFIIEEECDDGSFDEVAHIYFNPKTNNLVIYSTGDITIASEGCVNVVGNDGIVLDDKVEINGMLSVNGFAEVSNGMSIDGTLKVDGKPIRGETTIV